jgi:uncharacterized protein (UPF0335 family)
MHRRKRLAYHVSELERLEQRKKDAAADLADALKVAKNEGYDPTTLKVVLKLRKLTPTQRRERRALEAIYMASLEMLDGDALPEEARRRLDPDEDHSPSDAPDVEPPKEFPPAPPVEQPPLIQKDPAEARQEGVAAAAAGKRIYDNPYPAGDPCRAAWDEGWCGQRNSHGMDVPKAYQRREPTKPPPPKKDDDEDQDGDREVDDERGAA